jgi:hypothetical protein
MINYKQNELKNNITLDDPLMARNRPKANSYTLNTNKMNKKKIKITNKNIMDCKSKESNVKKKKMSKKISFIKSKKNSIKREDTKNKSKIKRDFGGFRKNMKIRLDISQQLGKFRKDSETEPIALKSCSMKNTISKFKFDNVLEHRHFELKPKFKEARPFLLNESRREKSINLIYKGKSKLKRNHTTKLLRNMSYYQENNVESKYGKKSNVLVYIVVSILY